MNIRDMINEEIPESSFALGLTAAEHQLAMDKCSDAMDNVSKLFTGGFKDLLDDVEHEFNPVFKMKAKAALELKAQEMNMEYDHFVELIKYNSEGVVSGIVNAIMSFFKAILKFLSSIFGIGGGSSSSGSKSVRDVATGKVQTAKVIAEAKQIVEESNVTDEQDSVRDDVQEEPSVETSIEKKIYDLAFSIDKKLRLLRRIESKRTPDIQYLKAIVYINEMYKVDVFKEQYVDFDANMKVFLKAIDKDPNKIDILMPNYSNSKMWQSLIRDYFPNYNLDAYPRYEICCINASVDNMGTGDSDVYVDLIIFGSDCDFVKSSDTIRVQIGDMPHMFNKNDPAYQEYMLFDKEMVFIHKYGKEIDKLPTYKSLFKEIRTMEKEFAKVPKDTVQKIVEKRAHLAGCNDYTLNYFNYMIKLLKEYKGIATMNYYIGLAVRKMNSYADIILALQEEMVEYKKLKEKVREG